MKILIAAQADENGAYEADSEEGQREGDESSPAHHPMRNEAAIFSP